MSKLNDLTAAELEHAGLVQHLEQLYATQAQDMQDLDIIHTQLQQDFTLPAGLPTIGMSRVSSLSRAESRRQGLYAFPTLRKARWARPLSLLVAVVVMTLVTGTFVSLLYLSHQNKTLTSSGGWSTPTTVVPPVSNLEGEISAFMLNANTGWLQDAQGKIKHTIDSGKTWQDVTPPSAIRPNKGLTESLCAISASSAWLIANSSFINSRATVIPTIAIISTIDGGQHWQKLSPMLSDGTSIMPTNISFFNSQEGWGTIFGSDIKTPRVSLIHTHDGGKTWAVTGSFPDALPDQGDKFLNFTSATYGWYASNAIGGNGNLYYTRDAGKTWQLVTLPTSSALQTRSILFAPRFFNASDGLLVKASNAPPGSKTPEGSITIYATHNGGTSWVAIQTVQGDEWNIQDANHWWVLEATNFNNATQPVTNQITLHFTSDAGQHWLASAQPQFTSMNLVLCISNQCGSDATTWAVGYTGYPITAQQSHLYKTTDGGKTWFQTD